MNILIIEDEPLAAERLISLIKQQKQVNVLGQFDTVTRSVDWLKKNPTPDLIFMDIQLADGLSFQIFDQVTVSAPVVFTTAYNEYALKAFKVNSIEYLLKPVDADELRAAFTKYETLTGKPSPDKMMESITYAMQMLTKNIKSVLW
jgi:DNA-binding LytR/AlgR family response regulator